MTTTKALPVALLLIGTMIVSLVSSVVAQGANAERLFHPVDLTDHYNKKAGFWLPGRCWSVVPMGQLTYEGVPFECGGVLELTGIDAARRAREVFRGRYTDIPVGHAGAWIHLIHCAGWLEADGVPIARILIHYENGETREMVIRYGTDVRNWWKEPTEQNAELESGNSKMIWSAPNPEKVGRPITLRIYKSSFVNPHPEWPITTLDLESLFSHATPVVIAVTVGPAGDGVKPDQAAPVPLPGRVVEKVVIKTADTGKPVGGARVDVVLSDGTLNFPFGSQTTDAAGRTSVSFSRAQIGELKLSVSAPGYETIEYMRNVLDLPPELELNLDPQAK